MLVMLESRARAVKLIEDELKDRLKQFEKKGRY